jgi:prophage regulatory protein
VLQFWHRNNDDGVKAMAESPSNSVRPGECLLRLPDVEARTGLRKSAIYAGMKAGSFPKCLKLGPRASAWASSEIDAWIAERIRAARA